MHQQTAFENIVGKEEIARKEQFLLFPQCFLLHQKIVSPFFNVYDIIFLFAAKLDKPKIGMPSKGLNLNTTNQSAMICLKAAFGFVRNTKSS